MNKKKKITILVCTLFMVFSLGACGKIKEDAAVVTRQESSLQIESMDEETTSAGRVDEYGEGHTKVYAIS